MIFRSDESKLNGYNRAKNYLIGKEMSQAARVASENALLNIIEELGPVVEAYPTWHPLVSNHKPKLPITVPHEDCGYDGLDHIILLANGFISCPYHDGQSIINSVDNLPYNDLADISAEPLDVQFYLPNANPILIRCTWRTQIQSEKLIPKSIAVPLMLEQELQSWRESEFAERWETMRPYFFGAPHGKRSSLFVNQETALAMKKTYKNLVDSGMYGSLKAH